MCAKYVTTMCRSKNKKIREFKGNDVRWIYVALVSEYPQVFDKTFIFLCSICAFNISVYHIKKTYCMLTLCSAVLFDLNKLSELELFNKIYLWKYLYFIPTHRIYHRLVLNLNSDEYKLYSLINNVLHSKKYLLFIIASVINENLNLKKKDYPNYIFIFL